MTAAQVEFLFSDWEPIARIVVVAPLAYLALLVLFRTTGNRTLARMHSFDFVITVAIGATFGRVLTARSIPLAEAVTAFAMLIAIQFLITWLRVRSKRFSELVTTAPTLVYFEGRMLTQALRKARITEDELEGAARQHGLGDLSHATAVVLEPNGTLSVVKRESAGDSSALASAQHAPVSEDADGRGADETPRGRT